MLSWQVIEHGKPLQKVIQQTPKPRGTEVLVRITRSGVCHSDLHIWDGWFDWGGGRRFYVKDRGWVPPFTMGHEPYGVVEALGRAAKGVKVGQKRIVYPWIGCGACAVCKAGEDNHCVSGPRFLGVFRAGAYATHLIVPHPKYLLDPGGLDESYAATLGCSALTAYSAAGKLPPLGTNDRVAIIGCGGLGLIGISVLRARGVKNIIACDIDPAKLAAAKAQGARSTLDTRDADAPQALQALAQGALAGALDFVGTPATAGLALGALRKGGGYVLCGLYGGELAYPMPLLAQRALSITGSYVGTLQELKEVVALARRGRLKSAPIDTRPAQEVNRVLEELQAGRVLGRVVLDFAND